MAKYTVDSVKKKYWPVLPNSLLVDVLMVYM